MKILLLPSFQFQAHIFHIFPSGPAKRPGKLDAVASLVAQMVKNLPASAGDASSTSEWGRSLAEGNGNPLQYSCLQNPKDRGAWWAIVHAVTKSQTQLMTKHACMHGFRKQGTGTLEPLSDFHRCHSSLASHSPEG